MSEAYMSIPYEQFVYKPGSISVGILPKDRELMDALKILGQLPPYDGGAVDLDEDSEAFQALQGEAVKESGLHDALDIYLASPSGPEYIAVSLEGAVTLSPGSITTTVKGVEVPVLKSPIFKANLRELIGPYPAFLQPDTPFYPK